jgi:hypothetical protein
MMNIALWSTLARQSTSPSEFVNRRWLFGTYAAAVGAGAGAIVASIVEVFKRNAKVSNSDKHWSECH